jgi:hypothetical protein
VVVLVESGARLVVVGPSEEQPRDQREDDEQRDREQRPARARRRVGAVIAVACFGTGPGAPSAPLLFLASLLRLVQLFALLLRPRRAQRRTPLAILRAFDEEIVEGRIGDTRRLFVVGRHGLLPSRSAAENRARSRATVARFT